MKTRHASKVTITQASLVSEATGRSFKSRMSTMESIVTAWEAKLKGMSLLAQSKQTTI